VNHIGCFMKCHHVLIDRIDFVFSRHKTLVSSLKRVVFEYRHTQCVSVYFRLFYIGFVYKMYYNHTQRLSMIHNTLGRIITLLACTCLLCSRTAKASGACPSGFSPQTGATGFLFEGESTSDSERVRCTSNTLTDNRILDLVGFMSFCQGGNDICIERSARCTDAGNIQITVSQNNDYDFYCMRCDAGSTRSGEDCIKCASDTYRAIDGANACQSCPAGSYSSVGSVSVEDCSEDDCEFCAAGSYAENEGSATCALCGAGKYVEGRGNTECDICPLGKSSLQPVHVCVMQHSVHTATSRRGRVARTDANVTSAAGPRTVSGSIYTTTIQVCEIFSTVQSVRTGTAPIVKPNSFTAHQHMVTNTCKS